MPTQGMSLDELLKKAGELAASLNGVAEGQDPDAPTRSNVGTFATVASMLTALSQAASRPQREAERYRRAVHRIANLEVRGAADLLHRQDWTRIAIELQAIAQEAVSGFRSH
jgi:hypothetical protein